MNDKHYTWMKAAGVRAIKTMAQTGVATIGAAVLLTDVNWVAWGSGVVLAGLLSILTSLAGLPEVDTGGQPIDAILPIKEDNGGNKDA